jgi:hypothetical protein
MKRWALWILYLSVLLSVFAEIKIKANPVNINSTNVLLLIALLVTIYDVIERGRVNRRVFFLFFVSISFLTFGAMTLRVGVGSGMDHLRTVVTLSKGVIVVLIISYWVDEYSSVKWISRGLIWAGLIAFLGAFLQGYLGSESGIFADSLNGSRLPALGLNLGVWRASGFLEGYGLLGVYVESAALLSAVGFLRHGRRQGWTKGLAFLGVVIAITSFLFSQSRSGLVATVVGYGVFYVLATFVYSRPTVMRAVPLVLVFSIILYIGATISEAIVNINRAAITNRLEGYWAASSAVANNPIFGIGFSNMYSKLDFYESIHNSYLNLLAGGGMVAFALYAYLNVEAIKEGVLCLRASDPRAPLAIGLLSALSAAMVECMLWGGGVFATAVFIILGLLISLGRVAYKRPVNA